MGVPVAAVDEERPALGAIGDIGGTWEIPIAGAEAMPEPMENLAHENLGLGVSLPLPAHAPEGVGVGRRGIVSGHGPRIDQAPVRTVSRWFLTRSRKPGGNLSLARWARE